MIDTGTANVLPRIENSNLKTRIVDLVHQAIVDGYYPPGSRLPTEQQLSSQMGVGRSSIREAIEHLSSIGLVERRRGRGVFVAEPQARTQGALAALLPTMLLDQPTMRWLLEVRQVVEPRVAAMAASRATTEDRAELAKIVRTLEEQCTQPELYAHTDLDFHLRIAEASGNLLFPRILQVVHTIFLRELLITAREPEATDRSFPFHVKIYESIRDRNPEAAESFMTQHLADVSKKLDGLEAQGKAHFLQAT